jgi:hypothetical protein
LELRQSRSPRLPAAALAALISLLAAGCGGAAAKPVHAPGSPAGAGALRSYLRRVEPIRLAVNRLLEGADPVLTARHEHRIDVAQAASEIGALERRFAAYAVDVAAIRPRGSLAALHGAYAHTYVLEDSYLSALASGLGENDLEDLPDTSSEQRAAIVQWRIGLEVLARADRVRLPSDLQRAGRGEIRPPPLGGS